MSSAAGTSPATSVDGLYRAEASGARRLAFLLVPDRGIADDLVQEAFAEAVARWDVVRTYERPDLWLRRVLVHRAISRRRRWRAERRALARAAHSVPTNDDSGAGVDLGAWRHVQLLPARQRSALALVYGCDLSIAEAAEVMGCSEGSVKTHLHRGRSAVAARLEGTT